MDPIVHSFGGSSLDRFVFDFEVPDGGGAPDGGATAADTDTGGGGAAPAESDTGAAADVDAGASTPAATPAVDWESPEVQDRINAVIEQREQFRANEAAEAERQAQASQQRQQGQSALEEKLALLDITPDELREFFGEANAPLREAAQELQNQKLVAQVDTMLTGLGAAHPDLLGDGVAQLAEFVKDDGTPIFDQDEVALANRHAVLFAASALDQAARSAGGSLDNQTALAEAAKQVSTRDKLIGDIAVQRYRRELGGVGNAARDLGNGGSGGTDHASGLEGGDELSIARRFNTERAAR